MIKYMETFYHINRDTKCVWKVGDEIELKEDNFYWQSFAQKGEYIDLNGEQIDVYKIATHAFDTYIRKHPIPIEMKDYHFNPIGTLKETIESLGNALKSCRELSFELVRKEFYPELPSRQKCIWIIPDVKESLEFWGQVLKYTDKRIFKITLNGKIHRAAQKWLIGGTIPLNKWNAFAHSYWKGEGIGSKEDEVLFEGKFKIIDEIN
jgi:hypothetical protein